MGKVSTRAALKGLCEQYAQSLVARRIVTQDQVKRFRPGGADNPDRDLMAWIRYHAQLRVWLARTSPEEKAAEALRRKQQLMDALGEVPESVTLSTGRTMNVYPKNDLAVRVAHMRNVQVGLLLDNITFLTEFGLTPEDAELIERAHEEINYLQRVLAWIYTTRGARLPFAIEEARPQPPDDLHDLASHDFVLIAFAAQRVNATRLQCVDTTGGSKGAPDWPAYWSGLAAELGTSTADLLSGDQSVVALVVASAERARAEREAMEKAKKENKGRRPLGRATVQ